MKLLVQRLKQKKMIKYDKLSTTQTYVLVNNEAKS